MCSLEICASYDSSLWKNSTMQIIYHVLSLSLRQHPNSLLDIRFCCFVCYVGKLRFRLRTFWVEPFHRTINSKYKLHVYYLIEGIIWVSGWALTLLCLTYKGHGVFESKLLKIPYKVVFGGIICIDESCIFWILDHIRLKHH